MTFYNNFKAICEKLNIKPTPLIIECGGSKGMYTTWKNGTIPKSDIVIALANRLGVSTDYLLLGKSPTIPSEYQSLIDSYEELSKDNKQLLQDIISSMIDIQTTNKKRSDIECITIKHSLHKVSAGLGEALDEGDNWEKIKVVSTPESEIADFAVTIDGESMSPDFHNGDIALVKEQKNINIGQVGIFIVDNNDGFIKELGEDRLISRNPKSEDIFPSENKQIECKGLVLGIAERVE